MSTRWYAQVDNEIILCSSSIGPQAAECKISPRYEGICLLIKNDINFS